MTDIEQTAADMSAAWGDTVPHHLKDKKQSNQEPEQ